MAEVKGNKIRLEIVTPYSKVFDDMVDVCVLPTSDGEMGVMAGHLPMIVGLIPGLGHFKVDNDIRYCVYSEGYAEISKSFIRVICNSFEFPDEISVTMAVDSYLYFTELYKADKNSRDAELGIKRANVRIAAIERFGSTERKERLAELKAEKQIG
ncbi:MAG: F0F1 ATP synthase subunit epsilon [Clostridia bacterium]|nr:F0F1 ATP synthase subunit epsilon [Clostridia bacterium]